MTARHRTAWTFAVTSAALFMASLDNLVVTTALPSIREHLHASLEGLQWTVNAYTLTFAVLLLTGATLGERYGRRRLFTIGLGLFTAGAAAAAMARGIGALVAARAVQGVGAAIVIPLTLTLLSAAVSPRRRGLALGAWGAVGGLAIAIGPLVGGAVVEGASWQWIFWLNVPIGIALLPVARFRLTESRGPSNRLDLPGLVLASVGLLGIVLGVVRGNDHGWTSLTVRPPRRPGAAGRRARPAGFRPRLAGRRDQPHRALPDPGPGVRDLRRRHVPVLRARRQRRAQLGPAGPGGDRLGREQRDQGTGRRLRDRRARRGVLRPGRLHERYGVRFRPGP